MAFRTNPAPYQRSKASTLKVMLALTIGLVIVWAFGILYSFKLGKAVGANYGIKAILNVVIAVAVSMLCDLVINVISQASKNHKVDFKETCHYMIHNYSYVSGIIFALTLPVWTNYYVVILGSLFATLVCKNCFGGFGKNVFNPAAMARIFVGLCFSSSIAVPEIVSKYAASHVGFGVDAVSGATLTTVYNNVSGWLSTSRIGNAIVVPNALFNGFGIKELLLGQYVGTLGETFTIVILAVGLILSVMRVINWRTPVFYLGTVALTATAIALANGLNVGLYVIAHLSLGGLAFGAVFMLTDPVTGPTSNLGKTIMAIFAGFMTVLIRLKGGYPEGVVYSIALANLISPAVDHILKGKTNHKYGLKVTCLGLGVVVAVVANLLLVGFGGSSVNEKTKYGLNYAEEAKLTELVTLPDGLEYAKAEGYSVKTDKVVSYVFDASCNDALDKVYLVKDTSGATKGYAYTVKETFSIEKKVNEEGSWFSYGEQEVTCYAFVVISSDGKVIGMNYLSSTGPATDANYFAGAKGVTGEFIGKNYSEVTSSSDVISGMSYSTPFIKKLLNAAYAEFNAK